MKKLSRSKQQAAHNYLVKSGRKIDLEYYKTVFEDAETEDLGTTLKRYQHPNGGFGYQLEPDHRTSLPSCYTTSFAFHFIEFLGLSSSDPMVQKALEYLKAEYIVNEQRWPAYPKAANNDPHAIWWHFEADDELCDAEKAWGLPSAEILGIMLKNDPENELWESCFEKALARIGETSPEMEMNEASCFTRMIPYLKDSHKKKYDQLCSRMKEVLETIIETDEQKWSEYSAQPLFYIDSPLSPFYQMFKECVDRNLDWEVGRQTSEGCWEPTWQWYRDEEYWPEALEEWKSCLTVEKLVLLKRFGRLE